MELAKLAGIASIKKAPDIITYAHPIKVTSINFNFNIRTNAIEIFCEVKAIDRTGVEMEALTGVLIAALNIYDMIKSIDRSASITDVELLEKSGGKSGKFMRGER